MPHLQQGANVIGKRLDKRVLVLPKVLFMVIILKQQSANRLESQSQQAQASRIS